MHYRNLAIPALATILFMTGCTPLHITKTVVVRDALPVGNAKNLEVVEEGQPVTKPYQVLGKATVYRSGTKVTKSATTERICEQAAQMGADGVIGLHRNFGGCLYSGIAVKWLAPGATPKPIDVPFVIALMPMITNVKIKGDPKEFSESLQKWLLYYIETKGYYLQPKVAECPGGLEAAKKLDDATLQNLGGRETDFLMEITLVDTKNSVNWGSFVMGLGLGTKNTQSVVRTTIFQKATRQIVLQKDVPGETDVGWWEGSSTQRLVMASLDSVATSLHDLKDIQQEVR